MSADNERLLERIAQGDTLRALDLLYADEAAGSARLAMNRALYGPSSDANSERVRDAEQEHRDALGGLEAADRATALYNLGCFALMQDLVDDARLRFLEVLELEPTHLMARHNLAYAYELLADSEAAQREYEAVLKQNPQCVLTRINVAQLKLQEGDLDGGIADLEALHGADGDNMGMLLYLCRGLLQRGGEPDLARVLALLDASEGTERYVDLQECRAYAQLQLGQLDAAEQSFARLLEAAPDNAFALAGMLKVLGQRSDFPAMRPFAERYQALGHSENAAAILTELDSL